MKIIRIDTAFDLKSKEEEISDLISIGYTITGKFCPDRYLIIILEKLPMKPKDNLAPPNTA